MLNEINEAMVLHTLKGRFLRNRIYTRLSQILVSINPYKLLPLYTSEIIDKYEGTNNVTNHPPHPYEIAKRALSELITMRKP